jgi:hypothetical protein
METERDLLALAAKAAGKKRHEWDYVWLAEQRQEVARDMLWDPRRDSGQALELQVQLRMSVTVFDDAVGIGCAQLRGSDSQYVEYPIELEPLAATRLAIFNTAVAIGRTMP